MTPSSEYKPLAKKQLSSYVKPLSAINGPTVRMDYFPRSALKRTSSYESAEFLKASDKKSVSPSHLEVSTCETKNIRRRSVSFDKICIREHALTLGDHPICSYGPPVCLDWKYKDLTECNLDEYEDIRGNSRSMREMVMNYYCRNHLLSSLHGFTKKELKEATKEVQRIQRQRYLTRMMLPAHKVEEVLFSAGRKLKRVIDPEVRRSSQKSKEFIGQFSV